MDHIVAIDPLALLLRNDIYVKINLPNPPPIEAVRQHVREIVKGMGPEERKNAMARAKALGAYASAMEKELGSALRE